jgi:ABC-type multidrug transport system permease subunit
VEFFLPGLLAAFSMYTNVLGISMQNVELRKSRAMKRLYATSLTRKEWVAGNYIAQTFLAFLLTIIFVLAGSLTLQVPLIPHISIGPVIFLGAVMSSGLGMTISNIVRGENSIILSNIVVFSMMFLSGALFPLDLGPPVLRELSSFLPLTYLLDALRITLSGGFESRLGLDFLMMGIFSIAFTIFGSVRIGKKRVEI